VSRDGHFVAFLSDRDGYTDVWVTQVGSGEFHNLTHGSAPGLANPSIRTLGFSPDGSLVTFWARRSGGINGGDISIWAVPTLGGESRPYLEGVAEFDWTRDGSRLAYHTPGPGDPLFVSDGNLRPKSRPIFTSSAGLHSHFPLWAPDTAFLYFVQGSLPDKLDIWRIRPAGGIPERITSYHGQVSYPVITHSFRRGVCSRSGVGARRKHCCLLRTRRRNNIFCESSHGRGRAAPFAGPDSDSGSPTSGLPAWRTSTRGPARRDST
jgi:Tol biopolymer transport system component